MTQDHCPKVGRCQWGWDGCFGEGFARAVGGAFDVLAHLPGAVCLRLLHPGLRSLKAFSPEWPCVAYMPHLCSCSPVSLLSIPAYPSLCSCFWEIPHELSLNQWFTASPAPTSSWPFIQAANKQCCEPLPSGCFVLLGPLPGEEAGQLQSGGTEGWEIYSLALGTWSCHQEQPSFLDPQRQ